MGSQKKRPQKSVEQVAGAIVGQIVDGLPQQMLTRDRYEQHIAAMRVAYPWVKDAVVRPNPGHLSIVCRTLGEIEEIHGRDALAERLQFLRIVADDDGDLTIFIDIENQTEGRQGAILVTRKTALQQSMRTCQVCGRCLAVAGRSDGADCW